MKPKKGCDEEPIDGLVADGWPCEVGKTVADGKLKTGAGAGKLLAGDGMFCDSRTLWYGWIDIPGLLDIGAALEMGEVLLGAESLGGDCCWRHCARA